MDECIPQETIGEIVRRLVEGLHPEQVLLFGSYAYGQPTRDSDVDLMVIVDHSDEPPVRRDQRAYGLLHGIAVPADVLVYTREEFDRQATVVTSLPRTVAERGMVLYERGKARGSRTVADQGAA